MTARQSVHGVMPAHLIYVRRSYKEATAADLSDEMQEAACRRGLPAGGPVRVISDSGGHQSGYSATRDGYQALLQAVRAGEALSVAVYDLSRLARNARLMLDLHHELERQRVPLLVANLPGANFDGATGRYLYGQLCLAAQLQRDLDSERMTGMQRRLFEDGRHRGHDPYGYRSLRHEDGQLIRPRQLVAEPGEAAIVRRIWGELAERSYVAVAENLNLDDVPHRGPWTRESVKDIARRGRVYLGYVVEKRGRDERPGRHEPIISESDYRRAMAAIRARTRAGNKPRPSAITCSAACSTVPVGLGCAARPMSNAGLTVATTAARDAAVLPAAARQTWSRPRSSSGSAQASSPIISSTWPEPSCAAACRPQTS